MPRRRVEEIVKVWGSIRGMGNGEFKKCLEEAERDGWIRGIESWLVRRKLAGGNATEYDEQFGKLLRGVGALERGVTRSWGWPTDQQVECGVVSRRMFPGRGGKRRVQWVFEGIESHLACRPTDSTGTGIEIEHIMPLKWQDGGWPPPPVQNVKERDTAIRTLGNLTLVPRKLNRDMSNNRWCCKKRLLEERKAEQFPKLNDELLDRFGNRDWTEKTIRERGRRLARLICCVWPRPAAC